MVVPHIYFITTDDHDTYFSGKEGWSNLYDDWCEFDEDFYDNLTDGVTYPMASDEVIIASEGVLNW